MRHVLRPGLRLRLKIEASLTLNWPPTGQSGAPSSTPPRSSRPLKVGPPQTGLGCASWPSRHPPRLAPKPRGDPEGQLGLEGKGERDVADEDSYRARVRVRYNQMLVYKVNSA